MEKQPIDGTAFRHVLGHYPTGVCAITSADANGTPLGMIVGTFTAVSLDPLLVGFLPAKRSSTWSAIQTAGHFCANVLASDQTEVCRTLAAGGPERFSTVPCHETRRGLPVIENCIAYIDCSIHSVTDAGDHWFVVGHVVDLQVLRDADPLVFLRGRYGSFWEVERQVALAG